MACLIALIDPTKDKIVDSIQISGTSREAEERAVELNQKLNKKPNPKEKFWKVTHINF